MEHRLELAARAGDIEELYTLIGEDANLFENIDKIPFTDMPLHVAASFGQVHFAMEIMRLKPSFATKLNRTGYTPIHLALMNGQEKLALRLVDVDAGLVRVAGREGKTALHLAAEQGMIDLLAEFLPVCPKSILDLTIRKESVMHVAVKSGQVEAVRVLLGWLERVGKDVILNWGDDQGRTVLHAAVEAPRNRIEMTELLINQIDINAKNSTGLTALDILESKTLSTPQDTALKVVLLRGGALNASSLPFVPKLSDSLGSKMSWYEKWIIIDYRRSLYLSSENRNIILLVAVLFATSNYQAALQSLYAVDGGMSSFYLLSPYFVVFKIINDLAFFVSMVEIFLHFPSDFGILRLVLPLVMFNYAATNLFQRNPLLILVMAGFLLVVYHRKLALILHKLVPLFVRRKAIKMKMTIFTRIPSLNRELAAKQP